MNTKYLTLPKCLCIVILILLGQNNAFTQPGFTANDQVIPDSGPFEFGTNNGYYPGWSDGQLGDLGAGSQASGLPGVGATAMRPGLFEYFTAQFGNEINLPAYQNYQALGMSNNTLFVGYASDAHKDTSFDCPYPYSDPNDPGAQTRVFKNMYLPIWDNGANGTPVNDDNYYALWLYELIQIYGPYVKYWEIFNEPDLDFSSGGKGWRPPGDPAGNWWDADPENCDIQFGAPIEYYNRMMRISWEVIKTYDPGSYVAVGGLGFPSFLDAMMRNTDNPVDGSVTAEYPLLGGAYFDCLSFHSYPHINGSLLVYNPQTNVLDPMRNTDMAIAGIKREKDNFETVLSNYGYDGTTYPMKEVIMTESNIPRKQIGDYIGSEEAQSNYMIKLPVLLQREGVNQFYVYDLGEKTSYANANHPFNVTGLYEDLVGQTYSTVVRTNGGIAYKTVSDQLYEKTYDFVQTAAMNLPPEIDGAAFRDANNQFTYVLWAVTKLDNSEFASAEYSFPTSFNLTNLEKLEWDFAETNQKTFITSQNIALTGAPIFLSQTNQSFAVSCPANITVESTNGANQVVTWNNPAASTNCTNGAITVSQTTGAGNGSSFPIGEHTISYTVSDNCGNNQNCSFTITVIPPPPPQQGCTNGQNELKINVIGYGSIDVEYFDPAGPTDNCNSTCTYCVQSGTLIKLVAKPNAGEVFLGWDGSGGCSGTGDCWKTISWETEITGQFSTNGPPPTILPSISVTETHVSCNGLSDGNVLSTVQDGAPSFSYTWNTGQTTQDLNNIPAGTYTVTVTDANGDTATASTTVNQPTALVGQILTQVDVSCTSGVTDGFATASAVGGAPPYSYVWSVGVGSATATDLAVGTYTVTIYDSNACSAIETVTIGGGSGSEPVADFSKAINGTTVTFTDLSSGDPTSWAWDFGDGNTGLGANPSHTYAAAGTYLACLSAGNSCGQNTFCQNISVGQNNDVLMSMGSASGNAGTIVQVALFVEGFENIVSFQHAISIVDTTKAEFVSIDSFDNAIMTVSPPTTNVSPESVSVVWLSSGAPVSIADGTALYYLNILIKGDPSECVDIVIDNAVTPTEFIMLDNGGVIQVPFNINNSQVCSSAGVVVSGLIISETGLPIEYVEVFNEGILETETNTNGIYEFAPYASGSDFVIKPHKDINHVNGVTSFDLAVIQQHIVGNAALSSPYKIIAADINASGQVSAFDLYLAQQVIVGNDSTFPGNESWRFVPADHVFTDPTDPWAGTGFPDSIVLTSATSNMPDQDFVAIKVGDVTDSAIPNDSLGTVSTGDVRTSSGRFEFFVDKKINIKDGSAYLEFMAKDFTQMSAFQFDLVFDNKQIEFEKIESDAIQVINGNKLLENGILKLVWYDKAGNTKGKTLEDETILFRIYFKGLANTSFPIQQLFGITEATTLPNAYTSDGSPLGIYLKPFMSETPKNTIPFEFEVLQNRPNPFSDKTNIVFYLPVEDQVKIEVFDVQGKVVHQINRNFSAGENMIEVLSDDLPHPGIYYFRLQTSSADRVQKMIFMK